MKSSSHPTSCGEAAVAALLLSLSPITHPSLPLFFLSSPCLPLLKFTYGRHISCHHPAEDVSRPFHAPFSVRRGRAMAIPRPWGCAHADPGEQNAHRAYGILPVYLRYIYAPQVGPSRSKYLLQLSGSEAVPPRLSSASFEVGRFSEGENCIYSAIGQLAVAKRNEIVRL